MKITFTQKVLFTILLTFCLCSVSSSMVLANDTATPTLLKDINSTSLGSAPESLVAMNGEVYFIATTRNLGRKLWKSDGTAENTVQVRLPDSERVSEIEAVIGDSLYFTTSALRRVLLWQTDGTVSGTFPISVSVNGSVAIDPEGFVALNNEIYFLSGVDRDYPENFALWKFKKSDLIATFITYVPYVEPLVPPVSAVDTDSSPYFLFVSPIRAGNQFFFSVAGALWKSDGTVSGTVTIPHLQGYHLSFSFNNAIYLLGGTPPTSMDLWKSDGTPAGTQITKQLKPSSSYQQHMIVAIASNFFYFVANDGTTGYELWRSDGTPNGTQQIKDIANGAASAFVPKLFQPIFFDPFVVINDVLFFIADDGVNGKQLWKSDGTEQGTRPLKALLPSSEQIQWYEFMNVNGRLFVTAKDGMSGTKLWKSDGSEEGTVLVRHLLEDMEAHETSWLKSVGGFLYFVAVDGINGRELWRSDGSTEGTVLVKNIETGTADSFPRYFLVIDHSLYFVADDGSGYELWKTEGAETNTGVVKDIYTGTYGSYPQSLISFNDVLFFTAFDDVHGYELWKSDGTEIGTQLVKDIAPGAGHSSVSSMISHNNRLYFSADDGHHGSELWSSDGSADGTKLLLDIFPGSSSSIPRELLVVSNTIYFSANDGTSGTELWASDGSAAGTRMVADLLVGPASSTPQYLTRIGDLLYFRADNDFCRPQLWRSDGTPTGTFLTSELSYPTHLVDVEGELYFVANENELWKIDKQSGTPRRLKSLQRSGANVQIVKMARSGSALYLFVDTDPLGREIELWRYQSTDEHSSHVRTFRSLTISVSDWVTTPDGTLYFMLAENGIGKELWKSNGTFAGTQKINLGNPQRRVHSVVVAQGQFVFVMDDPESGLEVWTLNPSQVEIETNSLVNLPITFR